MKNSFVLTGISNRIIRKVLKSLLMVIVLLLCVAFIKHSSSSFMVIPIASAIICLILLLFCKSYKVIGNITFEANQIIVELTNKTIKLPFNTIRQIKFIIRGRKRRSYWPVIYAPIGMNMADGTGNIIEIETDNNIYKMDIFLENSFDENSLEFQIKRLADLGVKIDKRKLPAILGDSI